MVDFYEVNKDLSDKEIEDFSNLTNKVLAEICRISDAHNIDRDSALKYFADMLTAFTKVATIQNYDSKQTNADRIRSMTDEELALVVMCLADIAGGDTECVRKNFTFKSLLESREKQTPKKPDLEGDGYGDDGVLIYDTWICPCCGKRYEIDYEEYDYCPNCGQAIDWSVGNEDTD